MKRVMLKTINERIKPLGYELVKGDGYFYFASLSADSDKNLHTDSVSVYRLSELSVDEWVRDLELKIEEAKIYGKDINRIEDDVIRL